MFKKFINSIENAIKNCDEIIVAVETKDLGGMHLCIVPDMVSEDSGLIMILTGKSTIVFETKLNMLDYNEEENEYVIFGDHGVTTIKF